MVSHVVVFSLVDGADAAETIRRLRAMEGRIPTLRAIEVGPDQRPSARSGDLCLITRFDDWDGLDAYAVHPVHQEVLAYMATVVARAVKVDWAS